MSRRCAVCGDWFRPQGGWQRKCWDCWRRTSNAGRPRLVEEAPAFTVESLLRDCVRLTHPDLHPPERFELANQTTSRLLELLDQARRGRAA